MKRAFAFASALFVLVLTAPALAGTYPPSGRRAGTAPRGGGGLKLPRTGQDIETLVGLAVVLLLVGLSLLVLVRQWRRRSRAREAEQAPQREHSQV